jgi:tRNA G18 (ribose-2'-O)-methylase SpoU
MKNVHDFLQELSVDEIKEYCQNNVVNAAVGMTHVSGDFNLGTVIRNANFFGLKEVFYVGGSKHYDARSTVGTHHYTPISFIKTEEEFINTIFGKYTLVCVENNIPKFRWKTISLFEESVFDETLDPPLFLFGEEQKGISEYLLNECGYIITIPPFGSVRSLNVGSTSAIIMAMYRQFYRKSTGQ